MSFLDFHNLPLSIEFRELLVDFVMETIEAKPENIYEFALNHFRIKYTNRPADANQQDSKFKIHAASYLRSLSNLDSTENDGSQHRISIRRNAIKAESFGSYLLKLSQRESASYSGIVNEKSDTQKELLKRLINKVSVFKTLDDNEMTKVIDSMMRIEVSENDIIINEGDEGNFFYVIQSGTFHIFKKDISGIMEHVNTFVNQGYFGEISLLYNKPRTETVVAKGGGILWTIDRATFKTIVINKTNSKRLRFAEFLGNVPLLQSLTSEERMTVADAIQLMRYEDNEYIMEQGEQAEYLYFVESGKVTIFVESPNEIQQISVIESGGYFGEIALMTDNPRECSAKAIGVTYVARIDRETFNRIVGPCLEILRRDQEEYNLRLKQYFN